MENKKSWWAPIWNGLIMDQKARHYSEIRSALWLFLYLVLNADRRTGRLLRKIGTMALDMGISRDTILSWLQRLKQGGYIETRSTGRFLFIQIGKWKAIREVGNIPPQSSAETHIRSGENPTSEMLKNPEISADKKENPASDYHPNERTIKKDLLTKDIDSINPSPDRDPFKGFQPKNQAELLALDLAKELDDPPGLPLYLSYAKKYPASLLRQALGVVKEIPSQKVKKSRGALFNYLVQKYAQKTRNHSRD